MHIHPFTANRALTLGGRRYLTFSRSAPGVQGHGLLKAAPPLECYVVGLARRRKVLRALAGGPRGKCVGPRPARISGPCLVKVKSADLMS